MINKLFKTKPIPVATSDLKNELEMLREENKRYIICIYSNLNEKSLIENI